MYSSVQLDNFRENLQNSLAQVIESGKFIMGAAVYEFENNIAKFTSAKHAIGCGNGTDTLTLALVTLGVEKYDVVFVLSFTFTATAETIATLGGTPFS